MPSLQSTMMQAIRYHRFGDADVLQLEQAVRPEPQDGEVLVRIAAAGVLPADWKIRKGLFPLPVSFPAIPGTAFAGTIEALGAGTAGFQLGQPVFGRSTKGTYCEFTTVPVDAIALKPESITFEEAATLTGGATTAWRAIQEAGVKSGDHVLIHGAAGGVGLFAVQFAKQLGAHVTATAGPTNMDYIRSIGADTAIDYKAVAFEDGLEGIDFVLDTIGGQTLERSWAVLKRGGTLAAIAGQPPIERGRELGIRVLRPSLATAADLAAIAALLEAGDVKAEVQCVLPLSEARQAHERSEIGHGRGRIVLRAGGQ